MCKGEKKEAEATNKKELVIIVLVAFFDPMWRRAFTNRRLYECENGEKWKKFRLFCVLVITCRCFIIICNIDEYCYVEIIFNVIKLLLGITTLDFFWFLVNLSIIFDENNTQDDDDLQHNNNALGALVCKDTATHSAQ